MEELEWRGLIAAMTSEDITTILEDDEATTLYCGFDPTAPSLHVGSLLPIVVLEHFRRQGHHAIALVGGATGQIGDPSGKNAERNLLGHDQLKHNVDAIEAQLRRILGPEITIENNQNWFKEINVLDFLRDTGKHFSVNAMLAMESVANRINREGEGISFTEFSYSLLQGHDFLHLFREHTCTLQIGGSDQWGNMCAGIDLIRRKEKGRAFGLTIPLLLDSNGNKFGKSEASPVWLDAIGTKPFNFYQFWLNQPDADVENLLKRLTFFTQEEIAELMAQPPQDRAPQRALAKSITEFVHGVDISDNVLRAISTVFSQGPENPSVADMELAAADAPTVEIFKAGLDKGDISVVEILQASGLCESKTDARRQIQQGAIRINNVVLSPMSVERVLSRSDFLENRILFLKKGKKSICLVKLNP